MLKFKFRVKKTPIQKGQALKTIRILRLIPKGTHFYFTIFFYIKVETIPSLFKGKPARMGWPGVLFFC